MTIEPKEGKGNEPHYPYSLLKGFRCLNFDNRYEKILDLMEVEVQPRALSALAQFCDPHLRTFMFHDFQLAPTLEEYECILGLSLTERQPYLYQGNHPSWARIATMLKVSELELAKKRLRRNDGEGIP
ncbi:hypothetical protein CR513_27244, partial [Mucuna pruriens]